MSWQGTITIKPNSTITFYKAESKNGTTTVGGGLISASHSAQIVINITVPVDTVDGPNGLFLKTSDEIVSALRKAAESNKRGKLLAVVNKIKSNPSYLYTANVTFKKSTGSDGAYRGPSNIYDTKSISGTIKVNKGAVLHIVDTPGKEIKYKVPPNTDKIHIVT